jgi:hypothetical protein
LQYPDAPGEGSFRVRRQGIGPDGLMTFEILMRRPVVGGGELKLNQESYYFFYRPSLFWILNGYEKNIVKTKI